MPAPEFDERDLEEVAEEIMTEADEDMSVDDLTRGTEVYEEIDNEVEEFEDDPQELDLEPHNEPAMTNLDFEDDAGSDEFGD